jgi:hypothetical protein
MLAHQEMTLGAIDSQPDTPHLATQASFDNKDPPKPEAKPQLPTSSSTTTIGTGCGAIMSEMRNKLIDIQNNKQYIE